jgi:phosphoglycolate phosphatase
MTRTVIFDLDGTLADTSGDLIAAANHCFRAMGAGNTLDPIQDTDTAVRGGRAMLTLGLTRLGRFSAEEVDRWFPEFLNAYAQNIDNHTTIYPGAMEAVERLRADGLRVGICTNKPEGLAEQLLTSLGIRGAFHSLIGADTLPVRKPDPQPFIASVEQAGGDPARSCLIGDTITDLNTAAAAGRPCVLVTFGPAGRSVEELKPDALLDHYDHLDRLMDQLLD